MFHYCKLNRQFENGKVAIGIKPVHRVISLMKMGRKIYKLSNSTPQNDPCLSIVGRSFLMSLAKKVTLEV
jgi:hypothetical protein